MVKNPSASAGDARDSGSIPRLGRSPGEGNGYPLQYSCLENPMIRGGWWATAHGVARSQRQLSDFHGDNDDDLCMISNFRGLPSAFACIICSWNSPGKNTGVGSHSLL